MLQTTLMGSTKPIFYFIVFTFLFINLLSMVHTYSQTPTDFAGQKIKEKAWVLTSNFALPAIRFNRYDDDLKKNSSGQLELFNSVGAGLSFLYGDIFEIKEKSEEPLSTDFSNIIGLNIGLLFSKSNTEGELGDNVFALIGGVSVLDIQISYEREFGDREKGIKRGFVTIGYAIPLFKLTNKSAINLNRLFSESNDNAIFF